MNRLTALLALALLLVLSPNALADISGADILANPAAAAPDFDAVTELQLDLIAAGYLGGEADGIPGPATEAAIREAQLQLGLPVDGAASDALTAALRRDAFPLRRESRGGAVYAMQRLLFDWGFMEAEPTGYFGPTTEDAAVSLQELAVEDFAAWMQRRSDAALDALNAPEDVAIDRPAFRAEDIPCDGVMTADWYRFLFEEFHFSWVTAAPEDRGANVKLIQRRLHALGYLYADADGVFGGGTELALKYFQYRNGLAQTGRCDEATGTALFAPDAARSDEYVMPYMAYVRRWESRVYIFGWDGTGYNTPVVYFRCSCGKPSTPTPEGTFYCEGPISDWYYMEHSLVWVRYAYKIQGNYFFHSVLFRNRGDRNPTNSQYDLGSNVSNGCIRLAVDDIRWIYENCPRGMKVIIE